MRQDILKRLMEVKGIKNQQLSDMTGLSKYEICKLRNSSKRVKISTLRVVANALNVPVGLLTKDKEEKHK